MKKIFLALSLIVTVGLAMAQVNPINHMGNTRSSVDDISGTEPVFIESFLFKEQILKDYHNNIGDQKNVTNLNPGGDEYDGDLPYIEYGTFTNDGEVIIIPNATSNNVAFISWDTQEILAMVDVNVYPCHVSVTDDYAFVSTLDNAVDVIELNNYSVVETISLPGMSYYSEVSPDGSYIYILTEGQEDYSRTCEVYSTSDFSFQHSIDNLPTLPVSPTTVSNTGKQFIRFYPFHISFSQQKLLQLDRDNQLWRVHDLNTGELIESIYGIGRCYMADISNDGNFLVAKNALAPHTLYQFDLINNSVSASIDPGASYTGTIAANTDGSKAYMHGRIIDFATGNINQIIGGGGGWNNNLPTMGDGSYVVCGEDVIDFDTEAIVDSNDEGMGGGKLTHENLYRIVGGNPMSFEAIYLFDFSSLNTIEYVGSQMTGPIPEGDGPYRVAVANDGSKAVVTNGYSYNASIVDLSTNTVSAVVELGEKCINVAITHDGQYAVLGGHDQETVKIIDLTTEELVAVVPAGDRPRNIAIAPDDSYAYVANIASNTISKILLDGENSEEVAELATNTQYAYYWVFGLTSKIALTPDGDYLLLPADNQLQIIETSSFQIIASIDVGDKPVDVVINNDGTFASVLNLFEKSISIIQLDGANSSLVGTFSHNFIKVPRIKYNSVLDQLVAVDIGDINGGSKIVVMNPETGELISTETYPGYGEVWDVGFDSNGSIVALTNAALGINATVHVGTETYAIDAGPIVFDVCPQTNTAVVACSGYGGKDNIAIVNFTGAPTPTVELSQTDYFFQLVEGEEGTDTLTIYNTGEWALNYSIDIAYNTKKHNAKNANVNKQTPLLQNVNPSSENYNTMNWNSSAEKSNDILWDNTNINLSSSGIPSIDLRAVGGEGRAFTADDFIVPDGDLWIVDYIYTQGFSNVDENKADEFIVTIYNDNSGEPGDIYFTETFITSETITHDNQEFNLSTPIELNSGHYWLSVHAVYYDGTNTDEYQWYWRLGFINVENEAMFNDYAGFWGSPGWLNMTGWGIDQKSVFFLMEGEKYGETAWLDVDSYTGSIGTDDNEDITIMINSTSLPPGFYEANLIINSNDPDNPSVNVEVTLEILPVGIHAFENANSNIQVYPNPAMDYVKVSSLELIESLQIFSSKGEEIHNDFSINEHNTEVNLQQFTDGIYIIKIVTDSEVKTHKIVKK